MIKNYKELLLIMRQKEMCLKLSVEIILKDQYIPIEVTLERRYRHEVESSFGYAEGEARGGREAVSYPGGVQPVLGPSSRAGRAEYRLAPAL